MNHDTPVSSGVPVSARRLPAIAAVAVITAVVVAGLAGGLGSDGGDGAARSPVGDVTTVAAAAAPSTTVAPTTTTAPLENGQIAAVPDAERTALATPIGKGMAGPEVLRLQERLAELNFDPGVVDGEYGNYTVQAVWAFQKLVMGVPRDQVSEVVTDEMWQAMQNGLWVKPNRSAAAGEATTNHTEIYLPLQVVVFFQNDAAVLVAHTSSGNDELWREEVLVDPGEMGNDTTEPKKVGYMALANTPGGVFEYSRFVKGRRDSVLGGMYDPAYFNFGIAIHGAENVPNYRDSHGCIRINKKLGEKFHQYIAKGDQVFVWNMEGDEPEDAVNDYPWNQLDPDSPLNTTTTPSTTTEVPSTTAPQTAPPQTAPPQTAPPQTQPPATSPPQTAAPTAPPTTTTLPPDTAPPTATAVTA